MTRIRGSGDTELGHLGGLVFSGEKTVERITCTEEWLEDLIRERFKTYDGTIANGYHPDDGSMLLAYVFMMDLFGEENVTVGGELETIPHERGVIE